MTPYRYALLTNFGTTYSEQTTTKNKIPSSLIGSV